MTSPVDLEPAVATAHARRARVYLRVRGSELWWAIPAAIVARLSFWLITQRVWEDALITIAHARNAVAGTGLTHHPGEPVTHGFTSALSVLIPLLGESVTPGAGLLFLRLASLLAVVAVLIAADRLTRALDLSPWPRRFVLAFLALDPLQVFYGMAGMETQVATAVLLWSALFALERRPVALGVSLGLALLARPDFAIWAAIVLGLAVFRSRREAAQIGLVALAVIAPWILFTSLYYGSPIPQTIIAKSISNGPPESADVGAWVDQIVGHLRTIARTFSPFLENSLVVSTPVPMVLPLLVSAVCWGLACAGTRVLDRRLPELGLFFWAFTAYRVLALPPVYFDWYVPPVAAVGVVLIAAGIDRWFPVSTARRAVALTGVVVFAIPLVFSIGLEARVQREIEDAVRIPLGQYLGKVVRPGEAVAVEAAGYFGYYSGATIYDYPGLTSKAALAAVLGLPRGERSTVAMMSVLRAPWIVVRPNEWAALQANDPDLAAAYSLCRSFSSTTGPSLSWGNLELVTIDDRFDVRSLGDCPGN